MLRGLLAVIPPCIRKSFVVSGFLRSLAAAFLLALMCSTPVQGRQFRICALSFNSSDELAALRAHLDSSDFELVDLSPPHLLDGENAGSVQLTAAGGAGQSADSGPPAWLMNQCRPDLRCDVVVYSGEFGGRFFGKYGGSIGLQDLEEAACQSRCAGLFHSPQEVFLLACNTLATKDQDSRSPDEYLQVLLDHGFDRGAAERVVTLRYGPLGPSFRESLRRIFIGVPRIYGFSSIAPRGEWAAEHLDRYFESKGDYARYLERSALDRQPNSELLAAFRGSSLVQIPGLTPFEPAAADRSVVCSVYNETHSVAERLRTVRELFARRDFLSFLPTIEVFFNRHPAEELRGEERQLFAEVQRQEAAREQVLKLVHDLNVSALKMELAHLALHLDWMTSDAFRRLAVDGARQLLAQPLTSEVVDIMCEITKHQRIGSAFRSEDLPELLFRDAKGLRLVDCLSPTDDRTSARLVAGLDSEDTLTRLWAAYALSRRLPMDDGILKKLARYSNDTSPDLRARLQWIFDTQRLTGAARQANNRGRWEWSDSSGFIPATAR